MRPRSCHHYPPPHPSTPTPPPAAPAPVAPRTPVRQACPAACSQRATLPPAGHARAAPRHARHPAPVPRAPVSGGASVGAMAVPHGVVKCALIPAIHCLPRTHPPAGAHHHKSPPRTPVRQSCPTACCQRATAPPAGLARRPETRQAPRARATRTCLRLPRCRCRGLGAYR